LREQLSGEDPLSLQNLSEMAGLSPSRFMHVFNESVGVPLRPMFSGSGFNGLPEN
jgi:hypothetical protein